MSITRASPNVAAATVKRPRRGADIHLVGVIGMRRVVVGVLGCAVISASLWAPAQPAEADSAEAARARARRAAADVARLTVRAQVALRAYDQALARVGTSIRTGVSADAAADAAAVDAGTAKAAATRRVRAIYMSGGRTALYVSVLDAEGISDFVRRMTVVDRVVNADSARTGLAGARSRDLRSRAAALDAAADAAVVTATDVEREWQALQALLVDGQRRLQVLDALARSLQEAEQAAANLRALQELAAQALAQRLKSARPTEVPGGYFALYQRAATTCPGLSWTVLAAIGQVETGHGRNVGPSSAGAMGPMQFMPTTFAAYAVDGDRDGDTDILDPTDSVYSAANYLCRNGAGRGGQSLSRAIWHYNHADWYVQLVLRIAAQLAAKPPAAPGAG